MKVEEFIEINPNKRFGKPILKGTRISVADILNWMSSGMSEKEILDDYPELSKEQIRACLHYAANREENLGVAS